MPRSLNRKRRLGRPFVPAALAAAVAIFFFVPPSTAIAQTRTMSTEHSGFIGAWRLTFETPLGPSESLLTIMPGGTLVFSGQPVKPASDVAPVTFISSAHGAWKATGARTGAMTWMGMVSDEEGNLLAVVTDSTQATLDLDGNSWEGVYQATVADPQDNVLFRGSGAVSATRITVQIPATPAASPVNQ